MFDLYAEAGRNFIGAGSRYTEGTSERYVGEFVKGDREHFVAATNYTSFMRREDPNFCGRST